MMKDEKDWNKKDLSVFKTQPFEQLVLQAYKYQRYKTRAALQKINRAHYSEKTATLTLDAVKSYLNYGSKAKTVNQRLYALVDQYKASHVGILTPPEHEKYTPTQSRKISPTPEQTTPLKYGVKIQNTLRIFDNKDFCLGYIECFTELNKEQQIDLVTINYELVEEKNNERNA